MSVSHSGKYRLNEILTRFISLVKWIQVFFEVANMSNYLVSIHRNPGALLKLRCLIFVIRNSIKSSFEPSLLRKGAQSQRDGLGRIYACLTRLWMVRVEKDGECDENLLNEMSLIHAYFLTHPPQVPQALSSKDFVYQGNILNSMCKFFFSFFLKK